jgi:putative phosphoribosyl transferase
MIYKDRKDAGKRLAEKVAHYRDKTDVIVLGLPRGGVTVAREIAGALNCPLDILIVRKIGFPGRPELAVGAVSETGTVVYNEDIVSVYGVNREYLERETARQKEELPGGSISTVEDKESHSWQERRLSLWMMELPRVLP